MLNVAVLMGRLVAEPELRYTPNGNLPVCRFRIAVDRNFTPQGQERKADFIDIVAWRQTAEFVCKYFHKGSMIAVNGEIRTDTYTDKDGNKRFTFEIQADRINFTGEKAGQGGGQYGQRSDYAPPAQDGYGQQGGGYAPPAPLPPVQQPPASFQVGGASDFQEVADDSDLPF